MSYHDFIATIAPYVVEDMRRSGVLASITIAQAILESGWGRSAPGNNLFGIKGSGQEQTTLEYVNGQYITIRAGFRVYDSWEGSIIDHSDFLRVNGRYARHGFFVACAAGDYRGAAWALQYAGYATDPDYAGKLIGIIEWGRLWEFDVGGVDEVDKVLEYPEWAWVDLDAWAGEAYNDKIISDWDWVQKIRDRVLTYGELLLLKVLIDERRRVKKMV